MFSPDDEIGHLRVDKLLKMIQYMKKFSSNLEIVKRWSTNSRKQGDAMGWADVDMQMKVPKEDAEAMDQNHAPLSAQVHTPTEFDEAPFVAQSRRSQKSHFSFQ